jgi:hypothetical protein
MIVDEDFYLDCLDLHLEDAIEGSDLARRRYRYCELIDPATQDNKRQRTEDVDGDTHVNALFIATDSDSVPSAGATAGPATLQEDCMRLRASITARESLRALPITFMIDTGAHGATHFFNTDILASLEDLSPLQTTRYRCLTADNAVVPIVTLSHAFLGLISFARKATCNVINWQLFAQRHGLIGICGSAHITVFRESDRLPLFTAHFTPGKGYLCTHLDLLVARSLLTEAAPSAVDINSSTEHQEEDLQASSSLTT